MKKEEFQKSIGNVTIYRKKPISEFLINASRIAYKKNKGLFKISPKTKIIICDNQFEFKKSSKYFYFSISAGTCLRDGTIVLKSPEFVKISKNKYKNLLVHEMNHSFWYSIYKTQKPLWIHEALATLIEGRLKYDFYNLSETKKIIKNKKYNQKILRYRYKKKDFKSLKKVRIFFSIWSHFLNHITNKDLKKVIKFLEEYTKNPRKKNYEKLFKKHFKISSNKKFKEFIEN